MGTTGDHGESCRSCQRAYLRVAGDSRHFNWECCGIGARPFEKHMPDNWSCEHYEPGPYRPRVEVETVRLGADLDL
jgi:hypothetical protein